MTSDTQTIAALDTLDREVSLKAELTNSGISVSVKSRGVAAIDHFLGGFISGRFGAGSERRRLFAEAGISHDLRLLELRHATEQAEAVVNARLAINASRRRLIDGIAAQENREAVAVEAVKLLTSEPQTEPAEASQPDSPTFDNDWMNYFAFYAEKASTNGARELWARVLAGEIQQTGAFSVGTMRKIAELSRKTAEAFQGLVEMRTPHSEVLAPPDPQNEILAKLLELQDGGLLIGVTTPLVRNFHGPAAEVLIKYNEFGLLLKNIPPGKYEWNVIPLSLAGKQLAGLIPWEESKAARAFAERLHGQFSIELVKILSMSGDVTSYTAIETLRESQ